VNTQVLQLTNTLHRTNPTFAKAVCEAARVERRAPNRQRALFWPEEIPRRRSNHSRL